MEMDWWFKCYKRSYRYEFELINLCAFRYPIMIVYMWRTLCQQFGVCVCECAIDIFFLEGGVGISSLKACVHAYYLHITSFVFHCLYLIFVTKAFFFIPRMIQSWTILKLMQTFRGRSEVIQNKIRCQTTNVQSRMNLKYNIFAQYLINMFVVCVWWRLSLYFTSYICIYSR